MCTVIFKKNLEFLNYAKVRVEQTNDLLVAKGGNVERKGWDPLEKIVKHIVVVYTYRLITVLGTSPD